MCQRCDTCDWYLVGIATFSFECAEADAYVAYNEITFSEEWILGIVSNQQASFSPRQCVRPCMYIC